MEKICSGKLFLVLIVVSLFTSIANAGDSLGIVLGEIKFFESGNEIPAKKDRNYVNNFSPETQFINIEFNVKNLKYQIEDRKYKLTFVWKYLNDEEFGRSDAFFNVKSDWSSAYINRGWGFRGKGNWRIGRFTAQVFVNDSLFAERDFFITPFGKDFISFPEKKSKIECFQNLPANISTKVLHQYKIEPYPFLNYYYDIRFSANGKDIAYTLSHYEHTSSNSGSSTTRDMYLFVNNKQMLPSYFMIQYNFDENLKNLAFFGLKLTSSNIYEAEGKGYFNGMQLYKSGSYLPVMFSPDSKKNCYILNTMPRLKSSFTWDNAYEFPMINGEKIQPESLKIARSINISESGSATLYENNSIVFLKNQDDSYNVVYTAKYKFDKQTYYALFNETERVSPQFNGYISRPYISADKKHIAYIAKDNKEWFIMLDNKRLTKGYKEIKHDGIFKTVKKELIFCKSGKNVIYQAKIKGDWYVMKGDEIISDGFSKIGSITVSPDETKIAYKAKSGKKWNVYINETKFSQEYKDIGEIVFSHDGKKIAYAASNGENMFVVIDDKQISPNFKALDQSSLYTTKQPLAISKLIFNKTGERLAYIVVFEYSGEEIANKMSHSFVMINDIQVSPKMYNIAMFSNQPGELYYAGIDIADLLLHHVEIDF